MAVLVLVVLAEKTATLVVKYMCIYIFIYGKHYIFIFPKIFFFVYVFAFVKSKKLIWQKTTLFGADCRVSTRTLRVQLPRRDGTTAKSYAPVTLLGGSIAQRLVVTDNKNKDTRNLKGDGR